MIREAIETIVSGLSLSMEEAIEVMSDVMTGKATEAQFGAFVTALRLKGETTEEIAGMARVMREKSLRVEVDYPLVDTCGTGGDHSNSFNISTTAGFVVAGAGVKVAKHGNRAMSGKCGSADVLEALGVKIDLSPNSVQRCLNEVGFGFMFAQRYHPSMRFAAGPRREIGIRTVFNLLGPLTNPANAKHQVVGVSDASIGSKMLQALEKLGSLHALVVHGSDGLDEITLTGPTTVWELNERGRTKFQFSPEDLGIPTESLVAVTVASVEESLCILQGVLRGKEGPARSLVLLNAAAALVASDRTDSLDAAAKMAAESIDSGRAFNCMESLVSLSQKLE